MKNTLVCDDDICFFDVSTFAMPTSELRFIGKLLLVRQLIAQTS